MLRSSYLLLLVMGPYAFLTSNAQDSIASYSQVISLAYQSNPAAKTATDHYLEAYHQFLTAVLNGSESAYEKFFIALENIETRVAEEPGSALNNYVQTEALIQAGFLKLKFGHELAAVWTMKNAYKAAEMNFRSDPENPLFLKSWGLMHILVGAIPDNYQWVPQLFGIHGSIQEGIILLEKIPSSHWVWTESQTIIQLTRSYLLDDAALAANEFGMIVFQRNSPVLDYLYLTLLLRAHEAEKAVSYFNSRSGKLELSHYTVGNALLQGGKYSASREHFEIFQSDFTGNDFKKDANYKMFLSYYLEDDLVKAQEQFARIPQTGTNQTESDRYAEKAFERPWPHPVLMKIRLATDGGYYLLAKNLIQTVDTTAFESLQEVVEFEYRKARLFHFTGQLDRATEHYLYTLELQGEERFYFAPNACLQLGYLLLSEGKMEGAKHYFSKVFEYKSYNYQKGIERKAHSALVTYFDGS